MMKTNQYLKGRREEKLLPNVLLKQRHHGKSLLQLANRLGPRRVKRIVLNLMMKVLQSRRRRKSEVVQLEKLLQQAKAENALENQKQHNKRRRKKCRYKSRKTKLLKSLIKEKKRIYRIKNKNKTRRWMKRSKRFQIKMIKTLQRKMIEKVRMMRQKSRKRSTILNRLRSMRRNQRLKPNKMLIWKKNKSHNTRSQK